jgi:opacity protein-like surface antigen
VINVHFKVVEMKKYCSVIWLSLLTWGLVAEAEEMRKGSIGVNGSVSVGGDVVQSRLGFGFQGELGLTNNFSVELASSTFSDEISVEGNNYKQDITSIGISGVYRLPISEMLNAHFLGGIDYNLINANMNGIVKLGNTGYNFGATINDTFGGHLGAGLGLRLAPNVELFSEYRFTMMNPSGQIMGEVNGTPFLRTIDGSYNFGLFKVGINYLFY